jgi:Immunity protein 27
MRLIQPHETMIEGHWLSVGGKVVADAAVNRIDTLVGSHLSLLAVSSDGWAKLFRDPDDGRLWEHTFPQSELQGGGPPRLEIVSLETARLRYHVAL